MSLTSPAHKLCLIGLPALFKGNSPAVFLRDNSRGYDHFLAK
ncbi:MAG: hypothetical protein ACR2OZ_01620 [Verrucomicrobiales bacterium]